MRKHAIALVLVLAGCLAVAAPASAHVASGQLTCTASGAALAVDYSLFDASEPMTVTANTGFATTLTLTGAGSQPVAVTAPAGWYGVVTVDAAWKDGSFEVSTSVPCGTPPPPATPHHEPPPPHPASCTAARLGLYWIRLPRVIGPAGVATVRTHGRARSVTVSEIRSGWARTLHGGGHTLVIAVNRLDVFGSPVLKGSPYGRATFTATFRLPRGFCRRVVRRAATTLNLDP